MRSCVSPPWLRWPSSTSTIDVGRIVVALRQARAGGELLHQREGDALGALADAPRQVAARSGPCCARLPCCVAIDEPKAPPVMKLRASWCSRSSRSVTTTTRHSLSASCSSSALVRNTIVKLLPEPVVCQTTPPSRPPSGRAAREPLQQRAHAEELLVARDDLADLAVEQHEAAQQFEQPRGAAGSPAAGPARSAAWAATTATRSSPQARLAFEQRCIRPRAAVLQRAMCASSNSFLAPARPELGRRARGAVAALGLAHRQQQLRVGEELRNLVIALVAQVLADAFAHHGVARLRCRRPGRLASITTSGMPLT